MFSARGGQPRVVVLESDEARRSRVVDALADGAAIETATTEDAVRERLAAGTVDCVVVGEVADDPAAVASTVAVEYPATAVVRFADGAGGDERDSPVVGVDAACANATALLEARVEAAVATRRTETLETTLGSVADVATAGVALLTGSGRIVALGGSFADTFDRDRDALVGASVETLYDSGTDRFDPVLAGERDRWQGKLVARTPAGDTVEREHAVTRIARDRVACVVHPSPGPAERETLRTDHSILSSMMERLPLSLYAKDEEARHVRVSEDQVKPPIESPDGELLTEPAQLLGKTDREIYGVNLADESYADDRQVIETGKPITEKIEQYETRFGDVRWTMTSKVPWTDETGTTRGLVGATIDITAEKEHEQELERQRERLEEFASVVAHDLRNPLSVAKGYLDAARSRSDLEELENVDQSLDRIERLIEDVLALARQGEDVIDPVPVSLQTVVRTAWKQVSTGDATLRMGDDFGFRADQSRLLQLVENLLRNAVEHGGDDVTITVEPLEGEYGFAIEDDGPGIPPEDRETIFESGYTTSSDGTGFGLAIVAEIAQSHGWDVTVTEGEDGGARFEITGADPRV